MAYIVANCTTFKLSQAGLDTIPGQCGFLVITSDGSIQHVCKFN